MGAWQTRYENSILKATLHPLEVDFEATERITPNEGIPRRLHTGDVGRGLAARLDSLHLDDRKSFFLWKRSLLWTELREKTVPSPFVSFLMTRRKKTCEKKNVSWKLGTQQTVRLQKLLVAH